MEPLVSFHEQRRGEVENYENLKRGKFPDLLSLKGLGSWCAIGIIKNRSRNVSAGPCGKA